MNCAGINQYILWFNYIKWFDYIYNNDLSPYIKIETIYFFYWLFKFAELCHCEMVQLFFYLSPRTRSNRLTR